MSTLSPPRPSPQPAAEPDRAGGPTGRDAGVRRAGRPSLSDDALTVVLLALLVAASLPLQAVFIGDEWVSPTLGAGVLAIGVGWAARRAVLGPVSHLLLSMTGLLVYSTVSFASSTAIGGVVPTPDTLTALRVLASRGFELIQVRPSPTFAEAGLLVLTVSGVWLIAYLLDGMLFVIRSAAATIGVATVLWVVPLAVAPEDDGQGLWTIAFLLVSVALFLLMTAQETASAGRPVDLTGGPPRRLQSGPVPTAGWVIGGAAVLIGVMLAGSLYGHGEAPWYEVRGSTGTTITTNPIVNIRTNLVAGNTGPVVITTADRPVYLRTTALDVYNDREEWTSSGIRGSDISGRFGDATATPAQVVDVRVDVAGIEPGAILAPAPFRAIEVSGDRADTLRFDEISATLTVDDQQPLVFGDSYTVTAALPRPEAAALRAVQRPAEPSTLTSLPANVPPEVAALARQIVDDAGAVTMFDQALAIQNHLRGWTYSTDPPSGLGATAMLRFIDVQTGYCEQFAGTMSVMLRTLDIPTRLAVGYTPGSPTDDGRFVVSNANAHAWVEVFFGDLGWIRFEPTPRDDGNVIVTSAEDVDPPVTAAEQAGGALNTVPNPDSSPTPAASASPQPGTSESELPSGLAGPEQAPTGPADATGSASGADAEDGRAGLIWLVLLGLVGVAAAVLVRSRSVVPTLPPVERVARARREVELLGAGLGLRRHPSETDEEYFSRLGGGRSAAEALADVSTRAEYAPAIDARDAEGAERVARSLRLALTDDLSAARRAVVLGRSHLTAVWERLRR